jgi:RNA polymerase sigma-70 factor (ECF subfamily)
MLSSGQEPTSSPGADEISDEDLVARILSGEETNFDLLYQRYSAAIRSYAIHYTDLQTGDDIAQQAFVNAYEHLPTLKKGESFKPWLYTITRHLILDYGRHQRLRQWVPWIEVRDEYIRDTLCMGQFGQTWEQQLENEEFIRQCRQRVSPAFWDCTYLAVFQECKAPVIAAILKIPERTVRRYIKKGEEQLSQAYDCVTREFRDVSGEQKQ